MHEPNQEQSPELALAQLEEQVSQLIHACEELRQENNDLRVRQKSLLVEHAALTEKTRQVQSRLESLIERLKLMEQDL